jgi:2-polyprenyl-6-methoxyphenol hydroxylase-like FAD-dependent oxidoreductase
MMQKDQKDNHTDVLIVGAGPAGLMAASQLAVHGPAIRIIDKRERDVSYSGALLIQARTLELFDMMGLAETAVREGQVVEKISIVNNGKKILEIRTDRMGAGISKFPYILMLSQDRTESLLRAFLSDHGISVESGARLESFEEVDRQVVSRVMHSGGQQEVIRSKYILGADGINSQVRRTAGIAWEGTRDMIPLFVTDCHVSPGPGSKPLIGRAGGEIIFSISGRSIAGFFPLKNGQWRIDSPAPEGGIARQDHRFEDATGGFAARLGMDLELHDPSWFSIFYPNTYLAGTFRKGRAFLLGDAAHVHTPIGAQGMNTGMQDACNLGWKIAFVINHGLSEAILDTYTPERRPVADRLIRTTDRYFGITIRKDLRTRMLRTRIIPLLLKVFKPLLNSRKMQASFFRRISQVGISYNSGRMVIRRWPFLSWQDADGRQHDLHEGLRNDMFVLFCLERNTGLDEAERTELLAMEQEFSGWLVIRYIHYSEFSKFAFRKLGVRKSAFFLVRPDGYVALTIKPGKVVKLRQYLEKLFEL